MKKMVSLVLTIILLFSILPFSLLANVEGVDSTLPIKEQIDSKLYDIFKNKIKTFEQKVEVESVKPLQDFAGNNYLVVECSPTGYMIYHISSGNFVEYSDTSISPYLSSNKNIFYGGPKEYYEKINTTYNHTVNNIVLSKEEKLSLVETCSNINTALNNQKDNQILDFFSNASTLSLAPRAIVSVNVRNPEFLSNLISCGEYPGGVWVYSWRHGSFLSLQNK